MQCVFVVPRDLPGPSGGTHYNLAVIAALRDAGHTVVVREVSGSWPHPSAVDRQVLAEALRVNHPVVVDGIMALAAPMAVRVAVGTGARVHVLIHSLLTADPALSGDALQHLAAQERASLQTASSTSCASHWSVGDVTRRHPGVRPHVLLPGTSPAPMAAGSSPPQLLALAAVTPVKNQLTLLRALSRLGDLPWTLELVGSDTIDPEYADSLRTFARHHLPHGRVTFRGALTGADLDEVWDATDLLTLTSTSETFGMVVTEALARGIPALVPAGTGAVEALMGHGSAMPHPGVQSPGTVINPRDADGIAASLTTWLTEPGRRNRWREAAVSRRPRLQTWAETAEELARILQ